MCKKFIFFISVVLVLALVNNAAADVLLQCDAQGDDGDAALQAGWTEITSGLNSNVAGTGINVTLATGLPGAISDRYPGGEGPLADVENDLWFADDQESAPDADFILTLGNLPAGAYRVLSYHSRSDEDDTTIPSVTVTGATNVTVPDSIVQNHDIMENPAEILFTPTGGDVVIRYEAPEGGCGGCQAFFNGFVLESTAPPGPEASLPKPANGADGVPLDVVLRWRPGAYVQDANAHDVYFGTDFDDVNDATTADTTGVYIGVQDACSYDPCDPSVIYDPNLLAYGQTYYWRIDEINDTCSPYLWKGTTWYFTIDDGKAKDPDPPDGKWGVPYYKTLGWSAGIDACDVNGHAVYFGTDYDDVNDATTTDSEYKGRQSETTYDPPNDLDPTAFYYWRIDEFNDINDGPDLYWKGDVWGFRVGGLLVGEYLFDDWYTPDPLPPDSNYTKASSDTSGFDNHAWHTTSGAEASITKDGREVLYLQNIANPFATTPPYAYNVVLPPEFGSLNPFDGSGDFTLMMEFKVKEKDDPNGGILLSSARDNRSSNHPMTIFMPESGEIQYENWESEGNSNVTTESRYDDPNNWQSLMVQYQASDGRLTVTMNSGTLNEEVETEDDHNPDIPNIEEDTVMIGWSLCTRFPADDDDVDDDDLEEYWEETQAYDFTGWIDNLRIYDYLLHFKAWDPFPSSGAGDVLPNVILNWKAGDFATLHHVYFGTASKDVTDANTSVDPCGVYMGPQALDANSYDPNGPGLGVGQLGFSKQYFWRIDEINDGNLWKGFVWNFTTTDGKAKNAGPGNDAKNIHPDRIITWSPGGYWVEDYKIYFSEDWNDVNDRTLAGYKGTQGVDSNEYDPCNAVGDRGLEFGKIYYWRIDETNDSNLWEGNIWHFTVDNGKAKTPVPSGGNVAMAPDPNLSWMPGIVATAHDVYFGTDWNDVNDGINNTFKETVVMDSCSYDPDPLWVGKTYYWRADSKNASEQGYATEVKGDIWSFTTEYPKPTDPSPYNPGWRIELDRVLKWKPGKFATRSDIYFGSDFDDVNDGSTTVYQGWLPWNSVWDPCEPNSYDPNDPNDVNSTYDPGGLALDTVYYWRIDSPAAEARLDTKGDVWQFKTYRTGYFEVVLLVDVTDWEETLEDANFMDPNYLKPGWGILTKWKGEDVNDLNEPNCPQFDAQSFDGSGDQEGPLVWTCNSECYDPCGTMCYGISIDTGQTGDTEGRTRVDNPNDAEPLCRDFFFNDGDPDDDEGDIIFTLHDLDDGYYELTTFHNDEGSDPRLVESAIVSGAVADPVHDYNAPQTNVKLDEACGFSFVTFHATGTGDVTVRYHNNNDAVCFNGFMLEFLPPDPNLARDPIPSGDEEEQPGVVLKWTPGVLAAGANAHDVYLSTDFDDVNDADTADTTGVYRGPQTIDNNSYDPPGYLTLGQRYYWRIDENNGETWKGFIWSFKMADYLIIDDFEAYDEDSATADPCIGWTSTYTDGVWKDYDWWTERFIESMAEVDVNTSIERGEQSMEFEYDNTMSFYAMYSEAVRPYEVDLLNTGVKAISLWFRGLATNAPDKMYVSLQSTDGKRAQVYYPNQPSDPNCKDPNYYRGVDDLLSIEWKEWHIKLEDFTAPYQTAANDVNLADVNAFYLGVGDYDNPTQTSGFLSLLYFDDIRVYTNRCVALYGPPFDWSGDCVVDHRDLKTVADDWLLYDETILATEPCDANLIAHWPFDETPNGVAETNIPDIVGGYNGLIVEGDPIWDTEGKYGWCLDFQEEFGVEIPPTTFDNISTAISILVWVNGHEGQEDHSNQILQAGDGSDGDDPYRISIETQWVDEGINWNVEGDSVGWYEPNLNEWAESWNHYAFTKDSTTRVQRMYLNGKVVKERTDATTDPIGDIDKARIGMAPDRDGDQQPSRMDDMQIYNYALNAGEVAWVGGSGEDLYIPIASKAELFKGEDKNSRYINFKDYALFLDQWLDVKWFPEGPP